MKTTLKYFLNVFGLLFMIWVSIYDFPEKCKLALYNIGFAMYASECFWSKDDDEKQAKTIEKLKEKVEELENKLSKTDDKTDVNLEDVPMNYDEYLDRVSDKFNGKTL